MRKLTCVAVLVSMVALTAVAFAAKPHNGTYTGTVISLKVKSGAILAPGATETWTVSLAPGQYLYTCDVPFHVDRGMTGALTVTP